MHFLYSLLYVFMSLLIGGMESDDWQQRQFSHDVVRRLTFALDFPYPVDDARSSPDIEVRSRCKRIMQDYSSVHVPANLYMYDFGVGSRSRLYGTWLKANKLPVGADTHCFVSLLIKDVGWTRTQAIVFVKYIETKKRCQNVIDDFDTRYQRVVDFFYPPPEMKWGCP